MLNLETIMPRDKNKYLLFGVVGAIIIILGVVAYFVFSSESESENLISKKSSAIIKRINVKEIDIALFSDPKFINLKKLKLNEPGLNELNIGQKDPFSPAQ